MSLVFFICKSIKFIYSSKKLKLVFESFGFLKYIFLNELEFKPAISVPTLALDFCSKKDLDNIKPNKWKLLSELTL